MALTASVRSRVNRLSHEFLNSNLSVMGNGSPFAKITTNTITHIRTSLIALGVQHPSSTWSEAP